MAAAVLAAAVAFLLVFADTAFGEGVADLPDAQPTAWHEAAGLTPLLTAPPPPNPATICIIDTGVTPTPDLDITARWAYDGGTLDDVHATPDSAGHGTSVAHFAAGKVNGWGHAGAFPHGRIASVRVFPREGGAKWQDYIRAIARCNKIDPNTKAIVISIGGPHIAQHEATNSTRTSWSLRAMAEERLTSRDASARRSRWRRVMLPAHSARSPHEVLELISPPLAVLWCKPAGTAPVGVCKAAAMPRRSSLARWLLSAAMRLGSALERPRS
jgi:hypothetical protein